MRIRRRSTISTVTPHSNPVQADSAAVDSADLTDSTSATSSPASLAVAVDSAEAHPPAEMLPPEVTTSVYV